jgi:hypothetical protein
MKKFEQWLVRELQAARDVRDRRMAKKGLEPTPRNIDNLPVDDMEPDLFEALMEIRILERVLQTYKRSHR